MEISLTIWHHKIDHEELQTLSAGRDEYRVWEPAVKFGESPYTDYKWNGTDDSKKWLCPNCGRPVHYGSGWRYYCDPCDESWFVENLRQPNFASDERAEDKRGVRISVIIFL